MERKDDEDIRVEAYNSTFEQFTQQWRFDLVLMVHSLYYMNDPVRAIDDALKRVNESGRLVILIASNDTLNELFSSFWERETRRPAQGSSVSQSGSFAGFWSPVRSQTTGARARMQQCWPSSSLIFKLPSSLRIIPVGQVYRLGGCRF